MDSRAGERENAPVAHAGASRRRIARSLNAAYAGGLLSEDTFVARLDQLLREQVIDPVTLVGDLSFRRRTRSTAVRARAFFHRLVPAGLRPVPAHQPPDVLLALDWSGDKSELLIGRDDSCDVVLSEATVSRHHARLVFRDGKWILHDLRSTNGTAVNGTYVGRCELYPGDRLVLGEERLAID
jgi:hypothetical protein